MTATSRLKRALWRSGVAERAHRLFRSASLVASSRYPLGTNVYDREWDALIVLDACRYDALRAVADEYDFLDAREMGSIWSVGSATREWVANTFVPTYREAIRRTAWVSANGSETYVLENESPTLFDNPLERLCAWETVDAEDFLTLETVWHREDDPGFVDPESVTDRAIHVGREHDPDRLIVQYMQPHVPYAAAARAEDREMRPYERDPWTALREGVDFDRVWRAYLDELRQGLDAVDRLLDNLDADRVVVTADHGETFGEWGSYSHPVGMPIPALRRVPWATTTATDTGGVDPDVETAGTDETVDGEDVERRLERLGYL